MVEEGVHGVDYFRKADFRWISLIRLPEFVTEEAFRWAVREATEKKQRDFSKVEFFSWVEGQCVQCMHLGPYDDEPTTVAAMEAYAADQGYELDFSQGRLHHEMSDARRCKPERLKNRHPSAHQTVRVRKKMNTIIHSQNSPRGIRPSAGISLPGHLITVKITRARNRDTAALNALLLLLRENRYLPPSRRRTRPCASTGGQNFRSRQKRAQNI